MINFLHHRSIKYPLKSLLHPNRANKKICHRALLWLNYHPQNSWNIIISILFLWTSLTTVRFTRPPRPLIFQDKIFIYNLLWPLWFTRLLYCSPGLQNVDFHFSLIYGTVEALKLPGTLPLYSFYTKSFFSVLPIHVIRIGQKTIPSFLTVIKRNSHNPHISTSLGEPWVAKIICFEGKTHLLFFQSC